MTPEEFCRHYPRLYHMASAGSWESIRRHGLLSTSAILDLFGISGERREAIESCKRPQSVKLSHPKYGNVVIRDNKPLKESMLIQSLQGKMTPREWYETLNGKVFFWPTRKRVLRLLGARAYRGLKHMVITVDTCSLLQDYFSDVRLSRINSGSIIYQATPRGCETFVTVDGWPRDVGPRSGKLKMEIAEVAVQYAVRNIEQITLTAEEMQAKKAPQIIWARS